MKKIFLSLFIILIIFLFQDIKGQGKDDYLNLNTYGDCVSENDGEYYIKNITFKVEHTGIFSKNKINKIKFRITIKDKSLTETLFSKIYEQNVSLYPNDVDYITVYINRKFTQIISVDYSIDVRVDYLPVY
jgi:hypothetical protein